MSRRRSIGSFLVAGVVAATAFVGLAPQPARSAPGVDFTRLAGGDRYGTAATIATNTFVSASFAILVNGERFPDAVAASYLAGVSDAPVLLSEPTRVPAATLTALQTLGVDFVVVAGGPGALSNDVLAQLTAAGYQNARVAGGDRYQTASALTFVTGAPTVGVNEDGKRTAILASGESFPDALAAGPVAYDEGFPLLLTPTAGLHPSTEQALQTLDVDHVVVVGGTGAVGNAVTDRLAQLGITFERLQGNDRYATARAIAEKAISAYGHTAAHVDIATGDRFPDALAGGPHAGANHGVIILTPTDPNAPSAPAVDVTCAYLTEQASSITSGHILGGEQVVPAAAETSLEACAGAGSPGTGVDPNIDFAATPAPGDDTLATLPTANPEDGASFTWTFTGVDVTSDVTIVPCFAVDPGSATTFAADPVPLDGAFPPASDDHTLDRAPDYLGQSYRSFRQPAPSGAAGAAQIVAVNGAVTPTSYVDGFAAPANGTVAVTVKAVGSDCAVPLVFGDPADDDELDLGADDRPTDDFGIGGAAVATRGEAPDDQLIVGEIAYLDEVANTMVLADGYRYDWGGNDDRYSYDDTTVSPAEFEIALSRLDRLGTDGAVAHPYHRSSPTRFDIGADFPGVATAVVATAGDLDGVAGDTAHNDVQVTWAAPAPSDGLITDAVVDVYRCTPTCQLVRQVLDSDHEPASAAVPPNPDADNDGLDDDVDRSVIVEDLSAGTYRFVVNAKSFTGHLSVFGSHASPAIDSAAAPGSPKSTDTAYTEAPGLGVGIVDPGDVLRLTFDQTMRSPDAGDSISVRSGEYVATLVNGSNTTFFVTGSVLRVEIDDPIVDGHLTYGNLQVTGSSGVTDPEGNEWDLPGSTRRTFG